MLSKWIFHCSMFKLYSLACTFSRWVQVLFVAVIPASAILNRIRHDHYDGDFVPMVAQLHGMVGILVTISITAVIVSDLLKEERR